MNQTLWILTFLLLFFLVGCTPQERISVLEEKLVQTEKIITDIQPYIAMYTEKAGQLEEILAQAPIGSELRSKASKLLKDIEARIKEYQAIEAQATARIDEIQTAIDNVDVQEANQWDELGLYGRMGTIVSRSIPNPYGGWLLLGSSVVTLLAGLFGGKKVQEKKDAVELERKDRIFQDTVRSVDRLIKASTDPGPIKEILSSQAPETRAEVAKVRYN